MYQEALDVIDQKPDFAYLLLVSCIEVIVVHLAQRTTESDLSAEIRESLAKVVDATARATLLNRILELDRGIARNFVAVVLQYVDADYWADAPDLDPTDGRIESTELPSLLKRIYDQRSRTLHQGEPFPPNIVRPPDSLAEIDRQTQLIIGERRWTASQFLPYVSFFERLVQHLLLQFLIKASSAR
jgi:hypothetical protein